MAIRLHRSPVLPSSGFLHGFPERSGGVSTGARASLNLGVSWGDDRALVEANRQRLADHAGYDPAAVQMARHVHGTDVWTIGQPLADDATFDGLVCDRPGAVLAAFAADCIPILFAEPAARVCGAAHAGWRGTVAGIARNMVAAMQALGARADRIRVALGPSIGPCCFEVGPEVVAAFRDALGDVPGLIVDPTRGSAPRPAGRAGRVPTPRLASLAGPHKDHIDLRVASRVILERAGVAPDHIDDRPPCTRCEPERFFSYRRDGRAGGIHMSFIGLV